MASLPNNMMLEIMFKRLRKEEGFSDNRIISLYGAETIYAILMNAKYKQETISALTNLEETLKKESGNYIQMYIAEKWEKLKQENGFKLPYPEYATKTLSDFAAQSRLNA